MNRWPIRKNILNDALEAHNEGKYTLSVPVLLAQADGISAGLLGSFLFTNHQGSISATAEHLMKQRFSDRPLAKSFLGLLLEASGLRLDTRKRDKMLAAGQIVSPLNRHGVLHGLDCDYATDTNSLRGIALIGFLEWVADIMQESNEEVPDKAIDRD